jgi:NAD(P)-dependent dehydrogenase (short-subunit alcohol dehydrogenase family)
VVDPDITSTPAEGRPLFVGHDTGLAAELAEVLGTPIVAPPMIPEPAGWDWDWSPEVARWGDELRTGPRVDSVVLCTWDLALEQPATPLVELAPRAWMRQVERPLAVWFAATVAAAERCHDGGSVVVVVELPAALDGSGRADVTAVAEGMIALARSAALVHGERGVRVNVVATEIATAPATLTGMAPALPSFPGRVAHEVAGAVRMLSSPDASGVTGTVLRADCGRSW